MIVSLVKLTLFIYCFYLSLREAFLRILVTVAGRQITQAQSQKLLERMGFKERTVIPFTDFFAYFREAQVSYPPFVIS
jgi:hypothetical protein